MEGQVTARVSRLGSYFFCKPVLFREPPLEFRVTSLENFFREEGARAENAFFNLLSRYAREILSQVPVRLRVKNPRFPTLARPATPEEISTRALANRRLFPVFNEPLRYTFVVLTHPPQKPYMAYTFTRLITLGNPVILNGRIDFLTPDTLWEVKRSLIPRPERLILALIQSAAYNVFARRENIAIVDMNRLRAEPTIYLFSPAPTLQDVLLTLARDPQEILSRFERARLEDLF